MRFSDDQYVNEYKWYGKYPDIHKNIREAIFLHTQGDTALDLGSCTGLLSAWLKREGDFHKVIGVEGNKNYVEKAVELEGVEYQNFYISGNTYHKLEFLMAEEKVDVVVARRVFPEIWQTDTITLYKLPKLFYDSGVKYIALEGRIKVKNAVNKLDCLDKEIEVFSEYYEVKYNKNNCAVLVRKGEI